MSNVGCRFSSWGVSWILILGLATCFSGRLYGQTLGAYYYPWWGQGAHSFGQTLRDRLTGDSQLPLIGNYDNRDLWTTAAHIDQSQAANVSMWSLSWWGPNSFEDRVIRDHLLPNPLASRLDYTIHYESTGRLGSFSTPNYSNLIPDFRHLAENVFSDPNYMRIDGRPVVVMYLSRVYFDDAAGWGALNELRTTMQTEYGFDPYIIGDHFFNSMAPGASQLDAVTAFDVYGQTFRSGVTEGKVALLANRYASADVTANSVGTDFVPGIAPGYNDRGVRLSANNPAAQRYYDGDAPSTAGSVFNDVIQDAALPFVDSDVNELILINSFNEWHEDTQIEASSVAGFTNQDNSASGNVYTQGNSYEGYGSKYLDILRTATGGPSHYEIYNGTFGDVNQDGSLDASDANAFLAAWSTDYAPNLPLREIVSHGDWNLDGVQDLSDAIQLQSTLRDAGHVVALEALVPSLLSNGGFEAPDLDVVNGGENLRSGWDSEPNVPNWNSDGSSMNSGIFTVGPGSAGVAESSQVGFLWSNDPSTYQTTNYTIQAGDEFTLQFAGARFSPSAALETSIYYIDGSTRIPMQNLMLTDGDAVGPLSNGEWNIYTLTLSTHDFPEAVGKVIGVEFNSLSGFPAMDGVVLWLSDSGINGDFDNDGQYNCADVDVLVAEIVAGTNSLFFDLTGDGIVNADDLGRWLMEAGAANLGPGADYLEGDANLDGSVDVQDFDIWNAHRLTTNAGWCAGDWNADGGVDVSDFHIWNQNKFRTSAATAIPEPATALLAAIGLLTLLGRIRVASTSVSPDQTCIR